MNEGHCLSGGDGKEAHYQAGLEEDRSVDSRLMTLISSSTFPKSFSEIDFEDNCFLPNKINRLVCVAGPQSTAAHSYRDGLVFNM